MKALFYCKLPFRKRLAILLGLPVETTLNSKEAKALLGFPEVGRVEVRRPHNTYLCFPHCDDCGCAPDDICNPYYREDYCPTDGKGDFCLHED